MKMEREIISSENIKPSSPTPPHLKTYNLSLLDQIIAPCFFPLVIHFPPPENSPKNADEFISQTTQSLRRSLSSTLTRFYPLAGRIRDSLSIDCNDKGALFVVSKIKANMSDFLKKPEKTASALLIPREQSWEETAPGTHILMIQVNYFDCGGIAIGSLVWHKAADGVTIANFLKAWAASARDSAKTEETEFPCYTAGSVFPQNEVMQKESSLFFSMAKYVKIGKPRMRRYVFDSSAICTLRTELTVPGGLEFRPSRVEIVSALIWKCYMAALSTFANESKSLATHSVNVRQKSNPSLPEHSFGNLVWLAPALGTNKMDADLKDLIRKMRSAMSKIDTDFVTRMQGDEGFSGYQRNVEETLSDCDDNAEYLSISSWCNFGLYKFVDFGFGKPLWMTGCNGESDTDFPFLNLIWLMDTREGDGIEAWVWLDEKYYAAFEKTQELQALASFEPSPYEY